MLKLVSVSIESAVIKRGVKEDAVTEDNTNVSLQPAILHLVSAKVLALSTGVDAHE